MKEYLNNLYKSEELEISSYKTLTNDIKKLGEQSKILSNLFKKLDPLASNKRSMIKRISVLKEVKNIVEIFQGDAKDKGIEIKLNNEEELYANIIHDDIYMALSNIVENAMFWVEFSHEEVKIIQIRSYADNDNVFIEILDNGPGISAEDLEDNILFAAGYSGKIRVSENNGTGLGLAIAGEAIKRNNGKLEVIQSSKGACFKITLLRS